MNISAYVIPGLPVLKIKRQLVVAKNVEQAEEIIEKICNYFGVPLSVVRSTRKTSEQVCYVRHWCIWFMCWKTKLSLKEIGKLMGGRDHSSMIYAREEIREQIYGKHENHYKQDYQKLIQII